MSLLGKCGDKFQATIIAADRGTRGLVPDFQLVSLQNFVETYALTMAPNGNEGLEPIAIIGMGK